MPQSVTNLSGSVIRSNWVGRFPFYGYRQSTGAVCTGYVKGIALSSCTGINGDTPMGQHLQVCVSQSITDGFPSAPCLSLPILGSWRFRWSCKAGPRSIYIWAQQNSTGSLNRPSMVVRSNPAIGLTSNLSASAGEGPGWKQIGPINFTATGNGVVWVELHNNFGGPTPPAVSASLFDHIITL